MRSFFALLISLISLSTHAAPLRFCFEDTAQVPWTTPDGSGLNFDLLKRVEAATGEKFQFVQLPWKRCIAYVATGEMDGVIGAVNSPEREHFAVIPRDAQGRERVSAALYTDHFRVYTRSNSSIKWDGKSFSNLKGSVAAQAGFVVVQQLRQLGVTVDDSSKSAENGLRLLLLNGVDAAVLQGEQALLLQRNDKRFRDQTRVLSIPFMSSALHLMVARPSYQQQPQRIEAIWNAIEKERASAEYQAHEKDVIGKLQ